MASGTSNYLQAAVLNWLKGTAMPAPPANTYLALYTAAPNAAGGGTEVPTTGGTLYARQPIASSGWSAISTASGVSTIGNASTVSVPASGGAGTNWGNIVAVALFDAASGGNMLFWGSITSTAINAGNTFQYTANNLQLQLGGAMPVYMQDLILNWMKGTAFPAAPVTTYLALYTAAPSNSGGGTEVSTSGGTLYARASVPSSSWGALTATGSGTTVSSTAQESFPVAGASWGTVVAGALMDSASGAGNELLWANLSIAQLVSASNTFQYPPGGISTTIS